MNRHEWAGTNAGRATLGALAVSAVVFVWTLVNAIRIEPVPQLPPPQFFASAALATGPRGAEGDIESAVQADLFAADRSAPSRRYTVPGEESDEAAPTVEPVLPVVLGTAVSDPAHSFATVQLGDGFPVIVRVGDRIGEYTVQGIDRERVVFTTAAKKRIDITELKP